MIAAFIQREGEARSVAEIAAFPDPATTINYSFTGFSCALLTPRISGYLASSFFRLSLLCLHLFQGHV